VIQFPDPVNWPAVVMQCVNLGRPLYLLAEDVGVDPKSLRKYRDGSIPSYEIGVRLLAIRDHMVAAATAPAPVVRPKIDLYGRPIVGL
jgi:hypothetical protein